MNLYQVKDWDRHFENDRSRKRDRCSFVCVPNKQHGMGFCRVMAEPDGAAIYGIWQCIVGACSQQPRPRNGWLTADGDKKGTPWGADDLALKFRRPVTEIQRALDVLSSKSVDWLLVIHQVTPQSPSSNSGETNDSPGKERKGREEKGKEEKEEGAPAEPASQPDEPTPTPVGPSEPAGQAELLPGDEEEGNPAKYRRKQTLELAKGILEYLNTQAGRSYQAIETNLKPIACRLEEVDLDTEGVKRMVTRQCARWKGDEKMDEYLRVSTLFNKTKFHEYYAVRDLPVAPRRGQPNQTDYSKGF